jgi:hypothetical protein
MEQKEQLKVVERKRRRSAQQILQFLAGQAESGLTITAYCKANGTSEKNFYRWAKKYRDKPLKRCRKPQAINDGFAKIEVLQAAITSDKPSLFAEIGNLRLYKEVSVEYLKALLV